MNTEETIEGQGSEGENFEQDVTAMVEQARERIEEFVHEQPHTAIGIAAALGFVLGGGLTPRRLIRMGLAAGGPLVSRQIKDQLFRIAQDAMESGERSEKKKAPSRRRRSHTENS